MLDLEARLDELKDSGLHRRMRVVSGPQGPRVELDGRPVLLLCSNNYLGLSDHPRVRGAAAEATMRLGTSAGASRLISGNMTLHGRLEQRLADFHQTEASLLFGSGYLANTGTIATLAGEGDVIFSDELNHASIIDGCRLARAETFIYRHADTEHLEWGLRKARKRAALIVTDGVFSMDGDLAPLEDLAELAQRHGTRLMVDEAHGTGAIGPGGRGRVAEAGLEDEVDVVLGTLGKALGGYGAYVCGSADLVDYLLNTARPFIFSTGLPPGVVAGATAALELLVSRPKRVERLAANGAALRDALQAQGLELGASESQIVPVIVGEADATMALCERALERGVFAQAIRPPTVPPGTCRLRLTAMATHRVAELRKAAKVIGAAAKELGTRAASPGAEASRLALDGVFVTGTGTEVGKTVVAAVIARTQAASGKKVAVFKPAVTGLDDCARDGTEPDHEILRRAAGSKQLDDEIAPYRYGPAASPHLAADLVGEEIDPARLLATARAAGEISDFLVCEGVGGFLVPLTPSYYVRTLIQELHLPIVIAASPGLGTINHTLLTLDAIRDAGLEPAMIVLTPWPESATEIERSNLETIARVGHTPVELLGELDLSRPESWPPLRHA